MKRGLIVLVLMLFLITSVYAQSLTIDLTGNKLGPNSNFDGYLTINLTDYKPFNAKVNFNVCSAFNLFCI